MKCGQLVNTFCFFYRETWNISVLCVETFKYYSWTFSFHFEFLSRRGFFLTFYILVKYPWLHLHLMLVFICTYLPITTDYCIFIVIVQSSSYGVLRLKHKCSVFTVHSIIVPFLKVKMRSPSLNKDIFEC